jgi:hypothetical protein
MSDQAECACSCVQTEISVLTITDGDKRLCAVEALLHNCQDLAADAESVARAAGDNDLGERLSTIVAQLKVELTGVRQKLAEVERVNGDAA